MEAKRLLTTTTNNNSSSTSSSSKTNSSNSNSSSIGTNDTQNVLAQLRLQTLTEATLSEHLHKAVDKYEADSLVQSTLERSHTDSGSGKRRNLFLVPSTRVFEYPLPVLPVLPFTSNGDSTIDLTDTPEKNGDSQDSDVMLTHDSQPVGASSRKRNLSQLSRANTADTVNTYICTSSMPNGKHKWIPLTLLSASTSSSNKSSVTEGTQLSQGELIPAVGAVSAFILV